MSEKNRLVLLLNRLHKKTLDRKVTWEPTAKEGAFQLAFSEYVVRLFQQQNPRDPDGTDYVLSIVNKDESVIDSIDDEELTAFLRAQGDEETSGYRWMGEMYSAARRIALGTEAAIDSLLEELGEE